jgi:hypothetical protein
VANAVKTFQRVRLRRNLYDRLRGLNLVYGTPVKDLVERAVEQFLGEEYERLQKPHPQASTPPLRPSDVSL